MGTLKVNAADWASSSYFYISSIDVVFSADAGTLVLNDKHGNEIFRATNGTNQKTVNFVVGKVTEGIVVATFTNVTQATVHTK